MNTVADPASLQLPAIGAPFEGGFFAGLVDVDGDRFALVVAPKFDGEHDDIEWNGSSARVAGAQSYCDGRANTLAMQAAGSVLAGWALDLRIGGFDDWYLPSQDELEICYRACKPTTDRNYLWARSGINLSAVPPTRPYAADFPVQTPLEAFQHEGAEAFEPTWYWTSTQHAGFDDSAWFQYFNLGLQLNTRKDTQLRARAVRRVAI
jgi:hypothetical protein